MTVDRLRAAGDRLVVAVRDADPSAPVPGLAWPVGEVARHTGAVHRWAADIVRQRWPDNRTGGSRAFLPPAGGPADLGVWLTEGVDALADELDAAPDDLDCFRFAPGPARDFWIRRQLHETTIHAIDVEAAAGREPRPVAAEVAADGLDELLGGFATEPRLRVDVSATLLVAPVDGPWWRLVLGGTPTVTDHGSGPDPPADATVRGTADQLYRWAWNRPVEVRIDGSREVAALWRRVRI